jgi:hypothetical protein
MMVGQRRLEGARAPKAGTDIAGSFDSGSQRDMPPDVGTWRGRSRGRMGRGR